MLAQPVITQRSFLPYQKVNAHQPRINADLLSRRNLWFQSTSNNMLYNAPVMQNKVELAIHQARMSAYQEHLLNGQRVMQSAYK